MDPRPWPSLLTQRAGYLYHGQGLFGQLNLEEVPLPNLELAQTLDSHIMETVTEQTAPLQLQVLHSPHLPLIVGYPWHRLHHLAVDFHPLSIHPSSSPSGKEGERWKFKVLHPDYHGLNSMTITNCYPLSLLSAASELLQGNHIDSRTYVMPTHLHKRGR